MLLKHLSVKLFFCFKLKLNAQVSKAVRFYKYEIVFFLIHFFRLLRTSKKRFARSVS